MDAIIPPITAMASGCSICEPAPIASERGIMPAIVASAVIMIGRKRRSPAAIIASRAEKPSARKWRIRDQAFVVTLTAEDTGKEDAIRKAAEMVSGNLF